MGLLDGKTAIVTAAFFQKPYCQFSCLSILPEHSFHHMIL